MMLPATAVQLYHDDERALDSYQNEFPRPVVLLRLCGVREADRFVPVLLVKNNARGESFASGGVTQSLGYNESFPPRREVMILQSFHHRWKLLQYPAPSIVYLTLLLYDKSLHIAGYKILLSSKMDGMKKTFIGFLLKEIITQKVLALHLEHLHHNTGKSLRLFVIHNVRVCC